MTSMVLLLLFPAIAYAEINITIAATNNADNTSVTVDGKFMELFSDNDRTIWGIQDDDVLRKAGSAITGRVADHIYIGNSTDAANEIYKIRPSILLKRIIYPNKGRVTRLIYDIPTFINKSLGYVTTNVTGTATTEWEQNIGKDGQRIVATSLVNYYVDFLLGEVFPFDFSLVWGERENAAESLIERDADYEKNNYGAVVTYVNILVEIDYFTKLHGSVIFAYNPERNYTRPYDAIDIYAVLKQLNLTEDFTFKEKLDLDYYSSVYKPNITKPSN